MPTFTRMTMTVSLILGIAFIASIGCSKKPVTAPPAFSPAPVPAEPAPPPAPTISLTAGPTTITAGETTTLVWRSEHAAIVTIDGGIGVVEAAGTRPVKPASSTTYTATAEGPGGTSTASVRVTVAEADVAVAPPPRSILDEEFFATRVSDVFFDFDKYDFRDDARLALNRNVASLQERPGIQFLIEGHCDERGSERYNLALGDRRANAAKQHLMLQGIDANRVDTVSYGEGRPFDPGHNEEAWARNRRAHFVLKTPRTSALR